MENTKRLKEVKEEIKIRLGEKDKLEVELQQLKNQEKNCTTWGKCNFGVYSSLEYDKNLDEFQSHAGKLLMAVYDKKSVFHTEMTVEEIDREFISRKK